jgi:hypothetical protein
MQVVVSVALLVFGFYMPAGNFDESVQQIAAGWVGAVIGYWLS